MGDCFTQIYDSKKIIGNIVNFLLENSEKIKTKIDYNLFFQPTQSLSSNSTVDDELLFKKNFSQYFSKERKETNKGTYKFLYKTQHLRTHFGSSFFTIAVASFILSICQPPP